MHIGYVYAGGQGDAFLTEASSDSEAEEKEDKKRTNFKLDEWLQFKVDPEVNIPTCRQRV